MKYVSRHHPDYFLRSLANETLEQLKNNEQLALFQKNKRGDSGNSGDYCPS